jgi:formylglycine-generating enzyme required for sulfatase activity
VDRDDLNHSLDRMPSKPAPGTEPADPADATVPAREAADAAPAGSAAAEPAGPVNVGPSESPEPERRARNQLGKYRLDRVIGSGGMGVVYEAWDEELRRRVALKVIAASLGGSLALERFQQEATLAARLNHPNIVVVHESGHADGQAFIAMELVEGQSLEGWITERLGRAAALEGPAREEGRREAVAGLGTDALREVAALVRDVASALHYGHTYRPPGGEAPAPIIHRDVKPANVMVDEHGAARLLDYGLAKELGVSLTLSREALGTPLYMSPEQLFSAKRVGPQSDVYSLGMTLYACLTLARPFELSNPAELFQHLMHDDPPAPGRLNPTLPDDLETIILTATAKDPRDRYASAADLAQDLDAFLDDRSILARRPGLWRRVQRGVRRRPGRAALAAGLLLAMGGGVVWNHEQELSAQRAATKAERELVIRRDNEAQRAREELETAGMLYAMAAAAKAEDPDGDRWLTILNRGHAREQAALDALRGAGLSLKGSPELQVLMQRVRVERNDAEAREQLEQLVRRGRSARDAVVQAEPVLEWLVPHIEASSDQELEDLWCALCEVHPTWSGPAPRRGAPDQEREALLILGALGTRGKRGPPPRLTARREQMLAVAAIIERRVSTARGQIAAAEGATDALLQAGADRRNPIVVTYPDEVAVPVGTRVSLRSLDGAQVLVEGAVGEVLLSETWGPVWLEVIEPGSSRPTRLIADIPRRSWGVQQTTLRVVIPASVAEAPEGMVLSVVDGQALWVDQREVTWGDYQRFLADVAQRGHDGCSAEERLTYPEGKSHAPLATPRGDQAPVTGVDWFDAMAYASWAGKRLPSGEEWWRVTVGGSPAELWEASWRGANFAGIDDGHLWEAEASLGPMAPCGAVSLVGNVAEWLLDVRPGEPTWRQAAGLGWSDRAPAPGGAPGADRFLGAYAARARGADLGFRCVRDLPPRSSSEPLLRAATAHQVSPGDGAGMTLVPGGELPMVAVQPAPRSRGAKSTRGGARPPQPPVSTHTSLVLSPFFIDERPVSVARWAAYLEAQGQAVPPGLRERLERDPEARMTGVSWEQAAAYASWAGKRLPTEAEWVAASRASAAGAQGLEPASFQGSEWCQDTWHADFWTWSNRLDPVNHWDAGGAHVVRARGEGRRAGGRSRPDLGFRCAQDGW